MSTKMQLEWRRRQVLAEQQGSRPDRDSGEIVDKRVHNQQGFGLLESIKRYIDERLRKVQECWTKCNHKGIQKIKRKDTGIIISKRMLFDEIRFTYQCYYSS